MDFRSAMVRRTLALLREINKTYGDDKATEVWESMSDTIGDSALTFEVFKALLNGGYGTTDFVLMKWEDTNPSSNKVAAIKMLRSWTGLGLKDSKEATEAALNGQKQSRHKIRRAFDADGNPIDVDYEKFEKDMKSVGFTVELE